MASERGYGIYNTVETVLQEQVSIWQNPVRHNIAIVKINRNTQRFSSTLFAIKCLQKSKCDDHKPFRE